MKVSARVWPDIDPDSTIEFDCTVYLNGLDEATVRTLIRHDWRDCKEADYAALESADPEVAALMSDLSVLQRYGVEQCGYAVHIDLDEAEAWLCDVCPTVAENLGIVAR